MPTNVDTADSIKPADVGTRVPAALRNSASWSLAQLDSAIRASVNAALARTKIEALTLRGYWLLEAIDTDTGIAQTELSETLGMDRSDMVRLIDTLEAAGLVTRTRDANDRRRQLITLTDDGKATRASLRRSIRRAERAAVVQSESYARNALIALLTHADAEAEVESEAEAEPETEVAAEPKAEVEAEPETKPEPEPKPEFEKSKKKSKKKKKKKKKKAEKAAKAEKKDADK